MTENETLYYCKLCLARFDLTNHRKADLFRGSLLSRNLIFIVFQSRTMSMFDVPEALRTSKTNMHIYHRSHFSTDVFITHTFVQVQFAMKLKTFLDTFGIKTLSSVCSLPRVVI